MAEWEILYYNLPLAGRAEFIRLIFEEMGISYSEPIKSFDEIREMVFNNGIGGFPVQFPPVLRKGDFHLGQTPVICKYLGEKFGLVPKSEEEKWQAEQVNATIHDFVAEGRLAFHGKRWIDSYHNQKEETQPYIDWVAKERIPKWLKYFEEVLKRNNDGQGFLFGSELTYVDLGLLQCLRGCEYSYPKAFEAADYCPLLKAFKTRMEARPKLAAYYKSERYAKHPQDTNSMM
ncbi:glutathione S-transferase P 1-like isoform X1 [Ostrea edulis]|uniref:glutathione S-transferase P 1-like isoform X1 n=1 Tax=Ostrea edulis TaxID=37623 RepID=UPI002094A28F|nr:glutathione S-transferase P 1-like isoform X1 [Ostrea edulis]XP_048754092.1 glutathione S-transferase P 1-like isoform X1 [Ostrea edulis]XP_048754093.1 glutathione S-transferase P 1-like isoform X1 [Ostrea edulis]